MVVEFSVKNFRSIRDLQTISFSATGLKSPEGHADIDNTNIGIEGESRILKTIGIYGPNASGKSNIIKAIHFFIQAIKNEPSSESDLSQLCDPFLYQTNTDESESFFQIIIIVDGKKFRYGFTVKKNTNNESEIKSKEIILSEWLYGTKEKNLRALFTRTGKEVQKETLPKSENIPPLPYDHTLFLTHASAFDSNGICTSLRNFLKNWTISNFVGGLTPFRRNSLRILEEDKRKLDFLELLSSFSLKYNDILIERDPNKPNEILSHDKISLSKEFTNANNQLEEVKLNLLYNESAGTRKLFDIIGLLLRAFNLHTSGFILLDEVDSNFHPSLLIRLIGLFNNPSINKSKSQLLFTSHDTNLMSPSIMRRDQFYFTEKNEDNSTRLYSLSDLKGIRNDADFAKQYLAGFYGALPILGTYLDESKSTNNGTMES